jgi:hypothetical protein
MRSLTAGTLPRDRRPRLGRAMRLFMSATHGHPPPLDRSATWWDERQPIDDDVNRADLVFRRIEAGPPSL